MSDVQDTSCDTQGWLTIVRQLSERGSGPPEPPVAAASSGTETAVVHPVERLTPELPPLTGASRALAITPNRRGLQVPPAAAGTAP
jgi:hypothetical protein